MNRVSNLQARSRILHAIRTFFHREGFTEVDTPIRLRTPALEPHIDAEPSGDCFLRTSPELHMKRLIAEGHERIFQLGPCFRRGERGDLHHPEFTMLEWYRAHADYDDILADTRHLVRHLAKTATGSSRIGYGGHTITLEDDWHDITVEQAYETHAGWNPLTAPDPDRFDIDMVEKIEPALPLDRPVILRDYPAHAAALARQKPGDPRAAERWELYIGGLELANAYTELTDPAEQRRRFQEASESRRSAGRETYELDEAFLAALEHMPPTGGIAMGIDRLVMLLTGSRTLDEVLPFRE